MKFIVRKKAAAKLHECMSSTLLRPNCSIHLGVKLYLLTSELSITPKCVLDADEDIASVITGSIREFEDNISRV